MHARLSRCRTFNTNFASCAAVSVQDHGQRTAPRLGAVLGSDPARPLKELQRNERLQGGRRGFYSKLLMSPVFASTGNVLHFSRKVRECDYKQLRRDICPEGTC